MELYLYYLLWLVCIILLNFVWKTRRKPSAVLGDSYNLLCVAKTYQSSGRLREATADQFLFDAQAKAPIDCPPLFPWLLSAFDLHKVERYQWLITPVFDTINLIVISVFSYLIAGFPTAVIVSLVYATTPVLFQDNMMLTGRVLSNLLFNTSVLSLIIYLDSQAITFLCLSLLASMLLILAHRLAVQALIFTWIVLILTMGNFWLLMYLPLAVLGAAVISKGYSLTVHLGHYRWLKFFYSRIDRYMRHPFEHIWHGSSALSGGKYYGIQAENIRTLLMTDIPFVWLAMLAYLGLTSSSSGLVYLASLGTWFWTLVVVAILIQLVPGLRFLGEGYRYLEYAVVPVGFGVAHILLNSNLPYQFMTVLFMGVLCLSIFICEKLRYSTRNSTRVVGEDLRHVTNVIQKEYFRNIMVLPLTAASFIVFHSNKRVLSFSLSSKAQLAASYFYPQILRPLYEFINAHDIDCVLLNTTYGSAGDIGLNPATFARHTVLGPWELYTVVGHSGSS